MNNPIPRRNRKEFAPYRYPLKEKILLNRSFPKREKNFLDVFLSRRSHSELSRISLQQLSEILYFCGKIQEIENDDHGILTSKRASPSAGGLHPIDLLISPSSDFSNRFLAYYNPIEHSLNKLEIAPKSLHLFINEINENKQIQRETIIWFSIQAEKTSSKYKNPVSLYWRDVGALLYCIQMVCTYLQIKSCPLGTLAVNSFHELFKDNRLISGGGILLG